MTTTSDHPPSDSHASGRSDPETSGNADGIRKPEGATNLADTDYIIGQDNIETEAFGLRFDLHGKVFTISALVVLAFVFVMLSLQDHVEPLLNGVRNYLTGNLTWFFLLAGNVFLLLCIGLALSPLGRIRLGGPDARPDHGYLGWFSMLFAAGMGIGLVFYGVSEPMTHFAASLEGSAAAPLAGAPGDEQGAISLALASTIFHWTMHAWAAYSVVALALALFAYNKGLPLTIRSIFYPLIGDRIWGWPGHVVDILAVFSTLFGLATSLGYGASQATAGLHYLFGTPDNSLSMVLLVMTITGIALFSVLAGLDKGIQRLSMLNMGLALILLVFMISVGPTLTILTDYFRNLGAYVEHLPALSMPFGREDESFSQGWTAFYWAWWFSWTPFVGMFLARVSRGRTVREFLFSVLLVPTLVTALWMTAFGETAIYQQLITGFQGVQEAALEIKLFVMLDQLPLATLTSVVGIVLVIVFFVTSSDSGSLVIDSITAGGKVDAPTSQRVFWCLIEGAIAIALLLGGGLGGLQAAAISTGLPFTVVLLIACYAVVKGLMSEPRPASKRG
ncbi:BCCT family transporter [Salinicola aestuarinus]|uniref:BCCT family transporter n=1 Tax=Salinicola aestuarinus TaxID=1949082 RepID=UPI000DA1E9A6|nr:BCCT family transporter [Salinicola aestuarinus]